MIFADVIIDISVKNLDKAFQYKVPEELREAAVVGAQVVIPFGRGNREMTGFITGLSDTPAYDAEKIKEIKSVIKQGVVVESHLLSLAWWMKENYGSSMSNCIKTVLPVKREIKEKTLKWICPRKTKEELLALRTLFEKKHHTAKVRVLNGLLEENHEFLDGISYEAAVKKYGASPAVLKGLEEKEILVLSGTRQYRNPVSGEQAGKKAERLCLNEEQEQIVCRFREDYEAGIRKSYLIHGVTGSGKTEVYMNLVEQVVKEGKQVIVLIPEIALTFQTVQRFYGRFGNEVSVIHSRLSAGERYDQFLRARRGELKIMVGPRSALFTPFGKLGLIIMDEEHETGYQSENPPKYHAREVALKRAEMEGASVVFGSATPSVEAYLRCIRGECTLFTMKKRAVASARLPRVEIVDLRQELAEKNFSIFSRLLQKKMEDRLEKKEQILLFLNRRGYAGFVSCRKCGKAVECDNCSVSMKAHEVQGKVSLLKCHYCGLEKPMPAVCPSCGSKYIGIFGIGTQQVEEMLRKRFPSAGILRMDADTTGGKEGHEKILRAFMAKEADILLGTQMIVKGHDFPDVTLVGVLAADLSLNAPDYRAAERTFALLSQAAGRAGRAEKKGEVVFQTYQPEHYSIVAAAEGDYGKFFRQEIAVRQLLQYPPISNILEVMVCSENRERAEEFSIRMKDRVMADGIDEAQIQVLGPSDAPVFRLKNTYRRVLYVKSGEYRRLTEIKDMLEAMIKEMPEYQECRLFFTFNG